VSITYCIDPRCTTSQRCWREANERYGNAPGENYGPRCIPAPPSVEQTYAQGIAEGERRERAAVVAWLRREATDGFVTLRINEACAAEKLADAIERGEHRREEKP
jgi:hypothetical protein